MTDILSQNEIDALLTAVSTGELDTAASPPVKPRIIKLYDFRRPDKFSGDQIRTLQMMHETFARLTAKTLQAQLRVETAVRVASVDQLTYGEFLRSVSNPTTLVLADMDPLVGRSIIEIPPPITFSIINLLMGGTGEWSNISRELTDLELVIMEKIAIRLLDNLSVTWTNLLDLKPKLTNIETNPQFAQIVPPNDMIVLISFKVKIGLVESRMNLGIPYITIEEQMPKLSPAYWFSSASLPDPHFHGVLEDNVAVRLYARYPAGDSQMSIRDCTRLKAGSRIAVRLDAPGNAEFEIIKRK